MPVPFDKALDVARNAKALLRRKAGATRSAEPGARQREEQIGDSRRGASKQEKEIESKKQELRQIATELRAAKARADRPERIEQMKRAKRKKQEIFRLKMELRAAEERTGGDPITGALPDFAVIGGAKCGTTFFYHVLTLHPHVEPAAMKETHFFDRLFEEGVEWYRGCFPKPRRKDGRMTIAGDGTPGYLFDALAPQRMAEVVPEARLIALLRNPVERTLSAYHHRVRNGSERRTFEEAVDEALKAEEARRPGEDRADFPDEMPHGFLSNCVYVDHLMRWARFFPKEQILVLKSEDFFERPSETLKPVFDFLGLPQWEPNASELPEQRKNKGGYEQAMAPRLRRRLEEFFEPHNRRLYEHLGVDFGW